MTKNFIQISEVKLTYQSKVKATDRIKINNSQDAFDVFYEHWDQDTIEHIEEFKILLFNRANRILGMASLFKGGGSGTVIDQKVIFQYSLKANAHQIILAHNHPSGNLYLVKLTNQLQGKSKVVQNCLTSPCWTT